MKRKNKRNQRLYDYHIKHPHTTLRGLALIFHITFNGKIISKQRVSQILHREAKRNTVSAEELAIIDKAMSEKQSINLGSFSEYV